MMCNDIVIRDELRPCLVHKQGTEKALWHKWVDVREIVPPSCLRGGHSGGEVAGTFALIEFENGSMKLLEPKYIQFLDSRYKFNDFDFTREY